MKTVLALVPHPDDAEYYCGGTLARLVRQGAKVHIVVATDGRCGSFQEDSAELATLRAGEMGRSAFVLGAEAPELLGYPDMGLDLLPPGVLRERFVHAIRRYLPDAIFAEDPYALYESHPDHRAVAWAATEAINGAHLPLIYPQHLSEGLQPHFVAEKYFYGENLPGANCYVDIGETLDHKIAAMLEHRTQVVFLVEGIVRQVQAAGLEVEAALAGIGADPAALLAYGLRAQATEVGRRAGCEYAEAFRYVRYHPQVEALLAT